MSYDLMVFDLEKAPKDHAAFMQWYNEQTEWSEDHSYDDPAVSSPSLQSWYQEMIQQFPPLNGPSASDDVDNPRVTDHCVGKDVIYSGFAWSCAEEAYPVMKALAQKHNVGFFDASGPDAEIVLPDGTSAKQGGEENPWWKFW